jgi:hypothetical protein
MQQYMDGTEGASIKQNSVKLFLDMNMGRSAVEVACDAEDSTNEEPNGFPWFVAPQNINDLHMQLTDGEDPEIVLRTFIN